MLVNFGFNSAFENQLEEKIDEVSKFHSGFEVKLNGFGHTGKQEIYIKTDENKSVIRLLHSLQAALGLPPSQSYFAWKSNITVAQGLDEEIYSKAMPLFEGRTFKSEFLVSEIGLLRRSGPYTRYENVREFELKG
jgi:hypothetical protein